MDMLSGSLAIGKRKKYCNGGDLPKVIRSGDMIYFKSYEWYENLEDGELKDKALNCKAILEESMNMEEESSDNAKTHYSHRWFDEHKLMEDDDDDISDLEDYFDRKDPLTMSRIRQKNRSKERRCKLLGIPYVKPPTCKSEKFEVVKYSFRPEEEYVAIKEYEYDIWVRTEENVSPVYRDIFRKKDEGWFEDEDEDKDEE
ncbi:hypothetical protein Tco_0710569 [Tanacetum coccineum]